MRLEPTITFVSAFLDLEEDRSKDKSPERCFSLFSKLAQSNISICLFVSQKYYEKVKNICQDFKNVYLMPVIELKDLWTYNITKSVSDISLPSEKLSYHDTYNFLVLMNAKIEFVSKAIKLNPFNTGHFAWIDFSICHVIHSDDTLKRLFTFSVSALKDKILIFPACWSKIYTDRQIDGVLSKVLWRFCGGFFLGDKESIIEFNNCYEKFYKTFLEEKKRIVWEVNFWAWLESEGYFIPESYLANHNDSILHIPSKYLKTVACMTTIPPRFERCKSAINSLLNQVDHVYLSVSKTYKRFGEVDLPNFSEEINFKDRVTVLESKDYGPATKYLGALSKIDDKYWVLFCDDDQIYNGNIVSKMTDSICNIGAYQNRYDIVKNGSGGIIHGYVGNIFYKSLLNNLANFELPECSRYVDDQWMSIYCYFNNINIYPTQLNNYSDIFWILSNGFELVGEEALASLGNRDSKVKELAEYFKISFEPGGKIIMTESRDNTL